MSAQSTQTNVPQLRFPEFIGTWKEKILGDLYAFCSTNSLSRSDLQPQKTAVANVHYGDIHTSFQSKFIFESEVVPYIQNDTIEKVKNYPVVEEGDLIFADASEDTADIGKMIEIINLNGQKMVSGLHTIHAKPTHRNKVALGFIADLFKTSKLRRAVIRESQGAKVLGISSKKIEKIKINIPEKEEQQKIASFLEAVDDKIAGLQKKKDLLEAYKKGMMQRLFSQSLRFQDDNGNPFPDWEETKLGELVDITTGNSNREDSTEKGEFVFFDRSNDTRASSKYLFDCEAIIVAGEGKDFPPRYFKGKFDLHQRAYAIHNFEDNHAKFLYYWIHWHRIFFLKYSVGSTMPSLRMNAFTEFPVKNPSFEEQKKIADFLSTIDNKIDLVAKELECAQTFKKGLLQQMFV